jgi:hypothetical protein
MRAGSGPLRIAGALLGVVAADAPPAATQSFTAPKGVGSVTLAWQYISNTGHRFTDGFDNKLGQSVTQSLLVDTEYAVSDRFSASVGLPFVFAKYTGKGPPRSGLPVDTCRCWNSGFGDFSLAARYRFGGDTWAVTPMVRVGQPSHAYTYRGEAVVGKQLAEAQIGVMTGRRLVELLPHATVQAGYFFAFVEKPTDDISVNRSNVFVDLGYAINRRIYLRGAWLWQHTHGGVRAGSSTGNPFPLPGELDDAPGRLAESDRILKVRYMQLAGGASVSAGSVDFYSSFTKYVWGRDAHNGWALGAGVSWYFGLPE